MYVSRAAANQNIPITRATATTATRRRQCGTTDAPVEVRIATLANSAMTGKSSSRNRHMLVIGRTTASR